MSFEHNGDVLSQQQTCLIVCRNALGIIMSACNICHIADPFGSDISPPARPISI